MPYLNWQRSDTIVRLFPPSSGSGRFLKKAAQKLLLFWACGGETSTP
jgi:hypothetical protein